jgi:hypothetical protein
VSIIQKPLGALLIVVAISPFLTGARAPAHVSSSDLCCAITQCVGGPYNCATVEDPEDPGKVLTCFKGAPLTCRPMD